MLNLGDKVKDRLSGMTGIVTGRTEYLYGCRSVMVNPGVVHEGKPVDSTWLDEDRCELVEAAAVPMPATAADAAGGPISTPHISR